MLDSLSNTPNSSTNRAQTRSRYPHRNPFAPVTIASQNAQASPSPIAAIGWKPPKAPQRIGVLASNDALRSAELLAAGDVHGPEDLALDTNGRLYFGSFGDGRLLRTTGPADQSLTHEVFANTHGSPVDLTFDSNGNLLVCDWDLGVLSVSPDGTISSVLDLGTPIDGEVFVRPDGIAQGRDGTLYLSEGSRRPGIWNGVQEVLEARSYGRLIAYHPSTRIGRTLLSGLSFANGVVLSKDESHLLISDQYRYCIARYWLTGERAGSSDTFAENLPGMPHNLHLDEKGLLWVGLYQGRNALIDCLAPYPCVKNLLGRLPDAVLAGPEHPRSSARGKGGVLALDASGTIVRSLWNPPARVDTVSAALFHHEMLYVGTLTGDAVLRLRLTT